MASTSESFLVHGTVREGEQGAAGMWVEAFDLDRLERADRLGEARSDAEGNFSIAFRKTSFAQSLSEALTKPGPNLVITVRDEDGTLRHMTLPRRSAAREESFEIRLDEAEAARAATSLQALGALADPVGYWVGKLALPASSTMHSLRRDARRLSEERLRRIDPAERRTLRSFLSLSVAFPERVAAALAACGAADLPELREWPTVRFRNALSVAGATEREIDREMPRFERLRALWPQDRLEDFVSGIDIDVQDRSVLSRSDWEALRRDDIATVGDWRSRRDELALSPEGRDALDSHVRLMVLGVPSADIDRFRRHGLGSARALARLDAEEIADLAATLRIAPAELASVAARARSRVAAIEEAIVRIVREGQGEIPKWVADASGVELSPPADAFPSSEAAERFGYLGYLRHLSERSDAALGELLPQNVLNGRTDEALEPVVRVVVWNEMLERARGVGLDHEAAFTARWRLLEARLQIGRLSPFELAAGDTNLELRLRAGLVAPFAPSPTQFKPVEMAMLEDRADRAARRRLERFVVADAEFAEGSAEEVDAEVRRRLADRMKIAELDAETLRYQTFRMLDARDDAALRRDGLIDVSLPAGEMTTRLEEAVVAMTILLERDGARKRALPFEEWRRGRAAVLWPHAEAMRNGETKGIGSLVERTGGLLAEAARHIDEAEVLQHREIAGNRATAKLQQAIDLLDGASETDATPELRLLRGKLGLLLLRQADALAQSHLPEARAKAAEICRAVFAVHRDSGFADQLGLADAPAALSRILGYAATRARREGELAGLLRRVGKVLEAQASARLAGASAADIRSGCRLLTAPQGGVPSDGSLEDLIRYLRSLQRAPNWPMRSIRERYEDTVDAAELRLPFEPIATEGSSRPPRGCSPLELLLAAPLPSRDPVADRQKLAAVSRLARLRSGTCPEGEWRRTGQTAARLDRAVEIVRDATLQLNRCAMFVRRSDQLASAGAALHERAISTTSRLAIEAGLPSPVDQVPFETRAEQWAEIVAAAPESIAAVSAVLYRGIELQELETVDRLAEQAASLASGTRLLDPAPDSPEAVSAPARAATRPSGGDSGAHLLDGPWRLTKTLSLGRLMPADLQAFREGSSGIAFRTFSGWFDEEFPKHCDRKIEGIGIDIIVAGNAPAMAGVKLWNSGIASAVSGPSLDERIRWNPPRLACLSAHRPSPESPRLETGVDRVAFAGVDAESDWLLEISDEVGCIDPASILDIELTLEYCAQGEYGQVSSTVGGLRTVLRERIFSLRRDFPAAWAAVESGEGGRFATREHDFASGLRDLAIANISLHVIEARRESAVAGSLRLELGGTSDGQGVTGGRADAAGGIASTRQRERAGDHPWASLLGRSPIGGWLVELDSDGDWRCGGIQDLVVAVTYVGVPRVRQD